VPPHACANAAARRQKSQADADINLRIPLAVAGRPKKGEMTVPLYP